MGSYNRARRARNRLRHHGQAPIPGSGVILPDGTANVPLAGGKTPALLNLRRLAAVQDVLDAILRLQGAVDALRLACREAGALGLDTRDLDESIKELSGMIGVDRINHTRIAAE